jgi:hypothetical protein
VYGQHPGNQGSDVQSSKKPEKRIITGDRS